MRLVPLSVLLACLALAIGACGGDGEPRDYTVRGQVAKVLKDGGELVVDHEDIPGYMTAMQMTLVVADPAEARGLEPGDKVILTTESGAFAEICVVDEHRIMPLPDDLSFEQGAGFRIIYATSYHAFRQRAPIDQGQSVLVLGAGGGVAAVVPSHRCRFHSSLR